MPRLADDNWRGPQAAASRQSRASRSSAQTGRRRGAVDDWRVYRNDQTTRQLNSAAQAHANSSFDPYSQVYSSRLYNTAEPNNAHIQSQVDPFTQPYGTRYSYAIQPEPQDFRARYALAYLGDVPSEPHTQWPQYGQDQRSTVQSHFRPDEPMRFRNGGTETQQPRQSAQSPRRAAPDATFTQQVPFRPMRGVDSPRGYATSHNPPLRSTAPIQTRPTGIPTARESYRRGTGRGNTPRPERAICATPPKAPVATQAYLCQAHLPLEKLPEAKRLLVILDLNGTLMLKPDYRRPDKFYIRPGAPKLLGYLFDNHTVMVYTSAQPQNAEKVARGLFSADQYEQLAAIWARDKLDLTKEQYYDKVQVYKKLDKVWANNEVHASYFPPGEGSWDQTNTILVDDSHLKALQQPHNLLQVPEFTALAQDMSKKIFDKREEQICQSLIVKLEALKFQKDVSRLIWRWQTGKADIPRVPGSSVFVDEKVDQKEQARKDLEAAMNLPTPKSPETSDDESVVAVNEGEIVLQRTRNGQGRASSLSPVTEDTFKDLLRTGGPSGIPTPTNQDG